MGRERRRFIEFAKPQTVALSAAWLGPVDSRNLMVDLTPNRVSFANATSGALQPTTLGPVSVRYTISFVSI